MTTTQDLLILTVAALQGTDGARPTDAADRVYAVGDWPTQPDQYPIIKARILGEQKVSLGRGGVKFTVTGSIRIVAEVSAPVQVDDKGAAAAEAALWALVRQIEVAVINSYPLTSLLQQFPTINTQLSYTSEAASHLAGAAIDIAMEFYQGEDDFALAPSAPLTEITATDPFYPGIGLDLTLPQ